MNNNRPTSNDRLRNIVRDYARKNAEQGRAFQQLYDPKSGNDLIDRLKMLGDNLLPSKSQLEAISTKAAEFGLGAVLSAHDHQAKAALEHELGRNLTDEEFSDLTNVGRTAFAKADRNDRSDATAIEAAGQRLREIGVSEPDGLGAAPDDGSRGKASFLKQLSNAFPDMRESDEQNGLPSRDEDAEPRDSFSGSQPDGDLRGGGVPEAPDDSASADADREARAVEQKASTMLADFDETEAILLTPVDRWSEGDMKRLLSGPGYRSADRETRDAHRDRVALWHGFRYGNDPVRQDGTGRMIQPVPKRPVPAERPALTTAEGQPFARALQSIASFLSAAGATQGPSGAVKRLQVGLNRLNEAEAGGKDARDGNARPANGRREPRDPYKAADDARNLAPGGAPGAEKPLKIDGDLGPKTAAATRRALARHGSVAVETTVQEVEEDGAPTPLAASSSGGAHAARRPRDGFGDPALLA